MNNIKNEVLVVLTERWNDWEASYAIAVINSFTDYEVKTIAVDDIPKKSMGGIKASVDYSINDYQNFNNLAIVILPGGFSWEENDYDEIAEFVKKIMKLQIPVAAICGATTFLCKHGLLNNIKHTGDSLELFKNQEGYTGEEFYIPAQLVIDHEVITANETAAVQFAYEIFKILATCIANSSPILSWASNVDAPV